MKGKRWEEEVAEESPLDGGCGDTPCRGEIECGEADCEDAECGERCECVEWLVESNWTEMTEDRREKLRIERGKKKKKDKGGRVGGKE